MNTRRPIRRCTSRWIMSVALALATAGAAAQTVGSAEELRAAIKKELTPLTLSIRQQAQAVTSDLAANIVAKLAETLQLGAPRAQLAQRESARRDGDRS